MLGTFPNCERRLPWLRVDGVSLGGALQQLDLRQHLKLLSPLVEVDETLVRDRVWYGGVDHGQVREEGAQVGYGAVAYGLERHMKLRFKDAEHINQCDVLLQNRDSPLSFRNASEGPFGGDGRSRQQCRRTALSPPSRAAPSAQARCSPR